MVRTVYADLLFLINFSMDFLCFFLVSRLFSRPIPLLRTLLASVFGGIYAVCSLFFPFRGPLLLLCDVLACALMCLVKEGRRGMSLRTWARETLLYTGVSMALGGVMTAVYSVLNDSGIADALEGESDGISGWFFFLLAAIGAGATLLGTRYFHRQKAAKYVTATVTLCGRTGIYLAMVDTGNALVDPISGRKAAALDRTAAEALLPETVTAHLDDVGECLSALPAEYRARARLLPVKTVTGEGILLAFRPDSCTVSSRDGKEREDATPYDILIALAPVEAEGVEMLLPATLF
ncbi:MAG: sigma-E processing peptidase SpoIIGA [Clostridia bacterium]|nr:sigma-E processing peptidase SpoIIGA [Clostridia bacterium]